MLQQILVFAIVVAAVLYAAWRLPGNATRLRYAALCRRVGLVRLGARLEKRVLGAVVAGGCKACSGGTQQTVHRK